MLLPMLVQYLVGLCCIGHDPEAVRITLGDMVADAMADKKRDVDVTVTISEPGGTAQVFAAYEVKRESAPLDVAVVEQLTIKMQDMPSVTRRAIVSTSGFTSGAVTKAANHGVELYELVAWTGNLEDAFPEYGMTGAVPEVLMAGGSSLLYWRGASVCLEAPGAPESFSWKSDDPLFSADGSPHPIGTVGGFRDEILLRSTRELILHGCAQRLLAESGDKALSAELAHTHVLEVAEDEAFLALDGRRIRVQRAVISGALQWETTVVDPEYYVMRDLAHGRIFAGAMVMQGPAAGQMTGLVLTPGTTTFGVHPVHLTQEQMSVIRNLTIHRG